VSEHGHQPEAEAEVPASVMGRVGQGIEKVITPIYNVLGWMGAAVIFALVVAMIYSAIGRYLNHPLNGSGDIIQYSFLVMLALALGAEHLGHEKMIVDAVVRLFPKKFQMWLEPVINIMTIFILVIAVWFLIKHGVDLVHRGEKTKGTLHLLKAPFDFIITFGIMTLIPIAVARFCWSVDRLVKR
jgi:TRAP-type C4-dicarboxylate transport system permease small subunit